MVYLSEEMLMLNEGVVEVERQSFWEISVADHQWLELEEGRLGAYVILAVSVEEEGHSFSVSS